MSTFRIVFFIFMVVSEVLIPTSTLTAADLSWAYPVPDKNQPPPPDDQPRHLDGSSKMYTQAEIDDQFKPPDWFPNEHAQPAKLVVRGIRPSIQACGSCHLMSGMGHPESADLAGLPLTYTLRQMQEFKSGDRRDPPDYAESKRADRMNVICRSISDRESREALQWFATLKPLVWYRVTEAETVPKTWVNAGRMRFPVADGGTEPIGARIITLPMDKELVERRDPHSGFIAYVPPGSLARGKDLVMNGGNGKTVGCALCHGDNLRGVADIPGIAGVHPIYIVRQLYNFKVGAHVGAWAGLMKKVVANLDEDDIIAIAAYVASQSPAP
jgi:cytochrome c553